MGRVLTTQPSEFTTRLLLHCGLRHIYFLKRSRLVHDARRVWFWIAAAAITLINCSLWFLFTPSPADASTQSTVHFKVVTPAREFEHTGRMMLAFDQDVFDTDAFGQTIDPPPFSIAPHVAADWRVVNARSIAMEPHNPPQPGHQYTISLAAEHTVWAGVTLDQEYDPQFTYQPLRIRAIRLDHSESVTQPDSDPMRRSTIEVVFNTPVSRTDCKDHTSVHIGGQAASPTWTSEAIAATHQFEVLTVPGATIAVEVSSGLTNHGGTIPINQNKLSHVKIPIDLEAIRVDAHQYRYSYGDPNVRVHFNYKLDPTQHAPSVRVTPDIGPIAARVHGSTVLISGSFEAGTDYVIEIEPPLLAADGTTLPRTASKPVHIPAPRPRLSFSQSSGRLGTTGAFELDLLAQGVKEARIHVDRLLPQHVPIYLSGVMRDHNVPQLGERIVDTTLQLDPSGLARKRNITLQLGTMMPQEPGVYRIDIMDNDNRWIDDQMMLLVSDLSMDLQTHAGGMLIWMTHTRSGKGVPNVAVTVWSSNRTEIEHGTTNADGLLQLTSTSHEADIVIARLGDDISFLHTRTAKQIDDRALSGSPWPGPLQVALYADRGVHRPGETIHLTGVVRSKDGTMPGSLPLEVRFTRPDQRVMKIESVQTDPQQSIFHIDLDTVANGPTGNWRATVHLAGDDDAIATITCPVMPVLPVRLAVESTRLEPLDGQERVEVRSTYLHGAPAAGLPASTTTTFTPIRYADDLYSTYRFENPPSTKPIKQLQKSTISQDGTSIITISRPTKTGTWRGLAETSVSELGGRATTARTHIDIDTATTHLGLLAVDGKLYRTNTPITVDAIRLTTDASTTQPVVNGVLHRIDNEWKLFETRGGRRRWRSTEIATPMQNVQTTFTQVAPNQWTCTIPSLTAGTYRITASTRSTNGPADSQLISTSLPLHVSDLAAEGRIAADRPDRLELVMEHHNVQPGMDTSVLVRTPFPGEALITVETDEITSCKIVSVTGDGVRIPITIPTEARDSCFVGVTLIRPLDPSRTQWLPIQARGAARITIDRSAHNIEATINAADAARPGDVVHVTVSAPRLEGSPASHPMVHLWAVEEGVLLLTAYNAPRLANAFLQDRRRIVAGATTTSTLLPDYARPVTMDRIGGDAARQFRSPVPIRQRDIQVLWHETRPLPQSGVLECDLEMPALDGAMRIMAVIVDGDQFGHAQHSIGVTAPLAVIAALPRAVAPGDSMDIPVQIHNHTTTDMSLNCTLEYSDTVTATLTPSTLTVPAGEQRTATLHVDANTIGHGELKLTATPNTGQPATLTGSIAIRPPFGRTTLVQHLEVMPGTTIDIERSRALDAIDGTIEVVVGGSPAIDLGEIINGLIEYPWGCGEQTGSRTQGLIAALRMPTAVTGVSAASIRDMASAGFTRLWNMQRRDGGIGYWDGERANPWITLRTALMALEAQDYAIELPDQFVDDLVAWAADHARKLRSESHTDLAALACRVLAKAGRPDAALLRSMIANTTVHSATTLAHLAGAAAETGDIDTAQTLLEDIFSHLHRPQYNRFQSATHDAAMVLDVILRYDLNTPLRLQLLRILTESRDETGWRTTFANAAAVDALSQWPTQEADLTVAGSLTIGGRDIDVTGSEPARYTITPDLTTTRAERIASTGDAPLYVTISSSGVPTQRGPLPALQHGIHLTKEWFDPLGNPILPNTPLAAGDLVTVDITVSTPTRQGWDDVALVDVLPGGMEFELPSLVTSAARDSVSLADVDHAEFLDDRMVVFLRVGEKKKHIRYVLRAVVPGQWAVPPTNAMAMYNAEAHGRTETRQVRIAMP